MTQSPTLAASSSNIRVRPGLAAIHLLWAWLAALASGVLLVLCFAPWNQQWLCWLALTPLLAAVWFGGDDSSPNSPVLPLPGIPYPTWRGWSKQATQFPRAFLRTPAGRGFGLGYVAGLVFFWGAFYWLWEVTPPGWFILAFYMALYFAIWGAFMSTAGRPGTLAAFAPAPPANSPSSPTSSADAPLNLRRPSSFVIRHSSFSVPHSAFLHSRHNLYHAFLAAACWVALEWVRGWMFSGFGWNDLGVGLHAVLPLIQIAEYTGVGGVSFLAVFANVIAVATVYRFYLEVRSHRVRPHFDFTLTIAGILAVFAYGVHRIQTIDRQSAQPGVSIPLRVAAVQADIPLIMRLDQETANRIFDAYQRLTGTALANRPQLLLWPESAMETSMFTDRATFDFVNAAAAQSPETNLLLGTRDLDFGEEGTAQADYNAAVIMPANGGETQIYRKIHLVPFGEYIPFRKSFPVFAWIVGDQVPGDFAAGTKPVVFRLRGPDLGAAPLICFEDTLGRLVRQPVLLGAQLLVNITNDVWFGRTAAPEQHLNESVFRAVENRRPLVRCANTGATAFIDTTGRVTNILRSPENGTIFTTGVLWGEVKVPARPGLTFYTRNGENFSIACGVAAGMAAWLRARRRRKA